MTTIDKLIYEIKSLPQESLLEVVDFVGYLNMKRIKDASETMRLSEKALSEDWDTPEEDEAWASL